MINVRQLSKTYETPGEAIQVLDHLDLTLATGETAAIVGPSGSGKSTLLNLLGALDRPTSGSITIGDQDISSFSEEQAAAFRNHSLGFIFQQQHLLPQLNVLENVLVPRLAGDWQESAADTEKRALTLLESVGLTSRLHHLPWQLSGGEKLRTAVARALINRPKLILADEPTGSLDEKTGETVFTLLRTLAERDGIAVILATHERRFPEACHRIFRVRDGQLSPL